MEAYRTLAFALLTMSLILAARADGGTCRH